MKKPTMKTEIASMIIDKIAENYQDDCFLWNSVSSKKVKPYRIDWFDNNQIECLARQVNRVLDEVLETLDVLDNNKREVTELAWRALTIREKIYLIFENHYNDFPVGWWELWLIWLYVNNFNCSKSSFGDDTVEIKKQLWAPFVHVSDSWMSSVSKLGLF